MSHAHNQDKEWSLVQRIRQLRESDPRCGALRALQGELVASFENDIRNAASEIRAKCASLRVFQLDRDGGILENHMRMWIIAQSVPRYDPSQNDSFAKYVFVGWRTRASIQEYLKEFKLPKRRAKDDEGNTVNRIVKLISLDRMGDDSEEDGPVVVVEDEQGELPRETVELRDVLDTMAAEANLTPERMLRLMEPLASPQCKPSETDEHRRRNAMIALLRDDFVCPDCSNEFQRRRWWNSLVADQR
mgnify:CR=1 FL=1